MTQLKILIQNILLEMAMDRAMLCDKPFEWESAVAF